MKLLDWHLFTTENTVGNMNKSDFDSSDPF